VRRTEIYPVATYLEALAGDRYYVANTPGARVQAVWESSFDAWVKFYRPNENTNNITVSYYNKGSLLALIFDLEIINDSKGKYSLDNVMRYMYETYYKGQKRGYTDAEFKAGVEKFAGKSLDDLYAKYVNGIEDIDYEKYLNFAGYHLNDEFAGNNDPALGITSVNNNGKIIVTSVARNSAAWIDGLNVNDEITAIDSAKVSDLSAVINAKKPGNKIIISILRDGLPIDLPVTLLKKSQVKYKIETLQQPTDQQLLVRKKWLSLQ